MFEIGGLNHITIFVADMATSLEFYQQILGMKVIHQGSEYAYLEAGKTWFCISQQKLQPKQANQLGIHHMALTINEEDFDHVVAHLRANGVTIIREPLIRGVGKSVNFLDPDGVEWEFHTSNLAERMNVIEQMERNLQK